VTVSTAGTNGFVVLSSSTNSASLSVNNTAAGGHNWAVGSSGPIGPGGAGFFTIFDNTANALRMTIDTSGQVSMFNNLIVTGTVASGGFSTNGNFAYGGTVQPHVFVQSGTPTAIAVGDLWFF
jgi:hypothetical protein